jgi:hypothetical protein
LVDIQIKGEIMPSAGQRGSRRTAPKIRRKNVNIDQTKLDRVRELLGSSSETEAIDQALDILLFREELIAGIGALAGRGGVINAFEDDAET